MDEQNEQSKCVLPHLKQLIEDWQDYLDFLENDYNYDGKYPDRFVKFWNNWEFEFARALIDDLDTSAVKVAKLILIANEEYENGIGKK